ncbi:MAG: sensor histidine kinase [Flavobacteriales bacterium]
MSAMDRSGRVLVLSIAGVLLLSVGFLIWSTFYLKRRQFGLNELALRRTQQVLHIRLDGMFSELSEDLREEAAALTFADSLTVRSRWLPLLSSHWPIMSIRMADEHGAEIAIVREDSTYLFFDTSLSGQDSLLRTIRFNEHGDTLGIDTTAIVSAGVDPREQVWFSQALEESRGEPSWSIVGASMSDKPMLQVSYLMRGGSTEPYKVIVFATDLGRSSWMDSQSTSLLKAGFLIADDEGRSLGQLTAKSDPRLSAAAERALDSWREKKTSAPFPVLLEGAEYQAMVGSYPLNGQQLHTVLVLDLQPLGMWLQPERIGLLIMGALMLALIMLLLWAWNRKRGSDDRIRKQAKRNRSQEMKLAKALGEREVLNREVHHRVKNNLQVVSSLLNLQATRLDDGEVKNEFLRGKRRIDTIALVHHKLYGLNDLRNVDLKTFFDDLIVALAEMHRPQSRTVSTEVNTHGIRADQDTAIELGIILCELVANTFQHAFPYATGGHVEIRVQPVEGDLYRLTVKDNGRGIAEGGMQGAGKLGLEIVEALSEQLDGSFHVRTNGGVLFEVLFRMQREVPAQEGEA